MIHPFDPDGIGDENRHPCHDSGLDGSLAADGTLDEHALRRLMHHAVQDIAPQADALDRLRRAVPARRARRRRAMVGAAAGVLLMGTAIPALLHAADSLPADSSTTANASPSQGHGGAPSVAGGQEQGGGASGPAGLGRANGGPGMGSSGGAQPSASFSAVPSSAGPTGAAITAPACTRDQLGDGSAQVGPPDATGEVYGSFLVVNISTSNCSIPGEGRIAVIGEGGVDAAKIQVVDHAAGDPATGLPDPAGVPTAVVLAPGKAYQVQFAWIPASSGSATGCVPSTTGGATGSSGSGGVGGSTNSGGSGSTTSTAGTTNTPSGAGSPSATPVASGITLTHTPQAGDPSVASATIAGACSGTIYRTAVLAGP